MIYNLLYLDLLKLGKISIKLGFLGLLKSLENFSKIYYSKCIIIIIFISNYLKLH